MSNRQVVRPRTDPRPRNHLLAALPEADFERLRPDLKTIVVRPRQVMHGAGERIETVYFPNDGVFSTVVVLPEGAMVEATTIGVEGMIGIEAFLDAAAVSAGQNLLQVPDATVVALGVRAFRRELDRRAALYRLIGLYSQVVMAITMQSSACNVRHHVQQRCAKWLLLTHDRLEQQKEFRLSHEFLAIMLGASRPTVSAIAQRLQQDGLITYTHGRVSVLDRIGLEAAACSCYPLLRSQFNRLLNGNTLSRMGDL